MQYRLYRLDGRRQIVGPPEYFEAADDGLALVEAQARPHPHLMEIWTGLRFVGLVTPPLAASTAGAPRRPPDPACCSR